MDKGKPQIHQCPDSVKELLKQLAWSWGETFDPEEGPSVMVDGYQAVGWDDVQGVLVYTPYQDPVGPGVRNVDGESIFPPDQHFVITEDELRRMGEQIGYTPSTGRPYSPRAQSQGGNMKITDIATAVAHGLDDFRMDVSPPKVLSDLAETTWLNDDECRIMLRDGDEVVDIIIKRRKP